jgi:hypothetical protein
MLKMNTATWIGIGAGIGGLLIGLYAAFTAGGIGNIMGPVFVVVFGGMFFLFWKLFFGPMVNTSRLQKTGIPGKAIVLEVKDTGVTINNNPQVKLLLEIKNSFGQKYNASCRVLVSRINPLAYKPGMEIPVKIDPKNEQNVVVDFSGNSNATVPANTQTVQSYSQTDIDNLKTTLEKMQQDHDAVIATGRSARAIIKKYTWLGVNVNGNNPYAEIDVEVLPESGPAFSGTTKGVISEASVAKYQPGKEIFVKYDLYDNNKIAIDHSM